MEEQTNYQLSTSVNEGILEIVYTGEITRFTIERLHTEVISIIKGAHAKAVLSDISALKGRYEEVVAAYYRARSIPVDIIKLPFAIVDLSKNVAYKSFYETTSSNAGQSLKWFTDIEAARTWLKSKL